MTLWDIGMDAERMARYVRKTGMDARVVVAGLRVDKESAMCVAVRRLVELGHRRIVMLAREDHCKPAPGHFERAFQDELEANGIATSS